MIIFIVIALITNPDESAYKTEIEDLLIKEINFGKDQNILDKTLASKFLQTVLWAVVRVEYQDYKLFSFFELKVGDNQMKYIGAFGQVIPLSGQEALSELKTLKP